MMRTILMSVASLAAMAASAQTIRYEAVEMSLEERPVVATGVEVVGQHDGGSAQTWDTTKVADGWQVLSSGEMNVNVLVLNVPAVVGGRLAASATWAADRLRVLRSDVIIPSGVTLTLGAGCAVKFLAGARFVVETGGALKAQGALLADFVDDTVGGDTNYDADSSSPSGLEWWLDDPATAGLATLEFFDGAAVVSPKRSYTVGTNYGELPTLTKEGANFKGWFTEPDGAGVQLVAGTRASKAVTAAYAAWEVLSLALTPESVDVGASGGTYSFDVAANGKWSAKSDSGWVTVLSGNGTGDGTVRFSVGANAATKGQLATIRVTMADGEAVRDFTIRQSAMGGVAAPVINPADGTSFSGSARRVAITCAETGASIRYTLDGSEPTATSMLYTKSFNVFDTTTIKAKAFKDGMLPSPTAISRVSRLRTLAEAIGQSLWTVTTDGDAAWTVDEDVTKDGFCSVRSGSIGDNESSELITTVEGAGTLTFWWRASCEDDPDVDSWDYLAVYVDNLDVEHIDGDSGWKQCTIKVRGEGAHTIRWVFTKDDIDDEVFEDCAWVDKVSWSPMVGESGIPVSWFESQGLVGADGSAQSAASLDPDGDGFTTEEEFIIGTDPTDPDSKFTANIEMVDGKPVITYEPDLLEERKYTTWGKKDLSDPAESWHEVKDGEEGNYNFFKMTVELL